MKSAFSDKASVIPRKMLGDPGRKWVLRDFVGLKGLSLGMAQGVLTSMYDMGCIDRVKKGPASYSRLSDPELLISEWTAAYQFSKNEVHTFYTAGGDFLKRLKAVLAPEKYALTLHSGANFKTRFVRTEDVHVYLSLENWREELPRLREKLDLKKLAKGGNIHLVRPFYRNTVFLNSCKSGGHTVVSNLQLYLDLYNFQPRGREHAEYLKETLSRKGKLLA